MARSANSGRIELSGESIMHPGYPHFTLTLEAEIGSAVPAGTILQMNDAEKLVLGDLTKRSYIAAEDAMDDYAEINVYTNGALIAEKLLIAEDASVTPPVLKSATKEQALTLMELSPFACA